MMRAALLYREGFETLPFPYHAKTVSLGSAETDILNVFLGLT